MSVQDGSISSYGVDDVAVVVRRLTPPEALNVSNSYVEVGTLFDAYCRTFFCDNFADRCMPPLIDFFPDLQKSEEVLHDIPAYKAVCPLENSVLYGRFCNHIYSSSQGRSFITTKEGYIGLAPRETKTGDVVCVLLGCETPLVSRPIESGQYKVVGGCYICGLMDGERLLGPLPGHFQLVWRLDVEFGYRGAYFDRETGETLIDDPRLGSFPEGWGKKSHRGEVGRACPIFVKDGNSSTVVDMEHDARGHSMIPD